MILSNAKLNGKLVNIYAENGVITAITDVKPESDAIDVKGKMVIPGLIDIHTHGCDGYDTMDAEFEGLCKAWGQNGTTSVYPTTMTMDFDSIKKVVEAKTDYEGAQILGFHMEGPYINVNKKGAQNEKYVKDADIEEFDKLPGMKLITIAPECGNNMDFIKKADTVVCIGHTEADYETSVEAIKNGAKCLTHTFNAMPPFAHRDPGPIGAAVTENIYVQVITDGLHVHKAAVMALYKIFGTDRMIIISDSLRACGFADGEYEFGGQLIDVINGVARVKSGAIAGSTSYLWQCVKSAASMGIPFEDAVTMATKTPATLMGLTNKGSIEVGYDADILVIDDEMNLSKVIIKGKVYHENN
ncbi:MAG: N-acetylglucosamine-6-phosphate deacetylase [Clostridiales bacterium]|nr:N-acetylglucosamine-6-phosphate deacetylase [Clostridiales bacterium]